MLTLALLEEFLDTYRGVKTVQDLYEYIEQEVVKAIYTLYFKSGSMELHAPRMNALFSDLDAEGRAALVLSSTQLEELFGKLKQDKR